MAETPTEKTIDVEIVLIIMRQIVQMEETLKYAKAQHFEAYNLLTSKQKDEYNARWFTEYTSKQFYGGNS